MYKNGTCIKKVLTFTSSHPKIFCKKGVLKNFAKFIEKHLCQSLFLIKLQAKACEIGVIFKNTLTPPGDCERVKRVKLVMDKI